MLPNELEKECDSLTKTYQKYKSTDNRVSRSSGLVMFFGLAGMMSLLLQNAPSKLSPVLTIIFGICFVISLLFGIKYGLKLKQYKLSGIQKVILYAYRAYSHLDSYIQPGIKGSKTEDLEKAKEEIENIGWAIVYGWKNYTKYYSVISSLDYQIGKFVENISKLQSAYENDDVDKKEIMNILQELIAFLIRAKKDSFNEINEKFISIQSVSPKLTLEEKMKLKSMEFIHKNISKRFIIVNVVLIFIGIITWYIFQNYPDIRSGELLIVLVTISIAPLIFYNLNHFGVKIGKFD